MTDLRIQSGQATLSAEVRGEGAAVILLHAGVADHRMWDGVVEGLAHSHHTVTYDRRGFGKTGHAEETYSPLDDLLGVLDACGVGRATLVGCSQGGKVALDFTLAHPERVAALVLIAPAVGGAPVPETFPPRVEALLEELESAEDAGEVGRLNLLEARVWLDGVLGEEGRVGGDLRDLFLDMNGQILRAPPGGEEVPAPSAWPRLGEVTVPTLLVCGDLDFPHVQERCRQMGDLMPEAQVHVMPGTAHLPSFEAPRSFGALLDVFLAQVDTSGGR